MALDAGAIAAGIAALSIAGVKKIADISEIPEQIQPRDCPMLFPSPNNWVSGSNGEPSTGPATFGSPSARMWVFDRIFNYTYAHAPAGSERGLYKVIPALSDQADAIQMALTALDIPGVDVMNISVGQFVQITDPVGGTFYGFTIALTMRERVNP